MSRRSRYKAIKLRTATTGAGARRRASSSLASVSGGGAHLPKETQAYFGARFDTDFSGVRVHTGSSDAALAASINARAFTHGQDIVFGEGAYQPATGEGRSLIAHELAHVVQQQHASSTSAPIQRKTNVDKPRDMIANPTGKGLVQTNAKTIEDYLKVICGSGGVKVDRTSGAVSVNKSFCTPIVMNIPMPLPGPPFIVPMPIVSQSPAAASKTATGCTCLCDMVHSKHQWKIKVDDASWPHTVFDDPAAANGKKPGGTGGEVTAPSPNNQKYWGAATQSGKALNIDPWLVLGHELCGHGWLGNSGSHGPDTAKPRGEGGHQETVKRENLLRAEHGIDLRGTYKDPYCGESFWRDKKKPGKVNWSSYLKVCEAFRKDYNKKHGTKYKISDKIP